MDSKLYAKRTTYINNEEGWRDYRWTVEQGVLVMRGSGCFDLGNGLENVIVNYADYLTIKKKSDGSTALYDEDSSIEFQRET